MNRYVLLSHGRLIPVEGEPTFPCEQIITVGAVGNVSICYDAALGAEGLSEASRLLTMPAMIEGPAVLVVTDLHRTTLDPFSWGITLGLEEIVKLFKAPKD